jgi:hypothetical protein
MARRAEIEWHCKHYVGRGLMKRFDSGEALAKEFGFPAVLKKTFDEYNLAAKTKKDRFAKKVWYSFHLLTCPLLTATTSSSRMTTGR